MGCCRQKSERASQQLQSLLDKKDYFRLSESLGAVMDKISTKSYTYYHAFVESAFNQVKKSQEDIQTLLTLYASVLNDTERVALLSLEEKNYFLAFDYAHAAQTDRELLNHYSHILDSTVVKDIQNELLVRNALAGIAPQEITQTETTTLHWTRDKIGLMEIPLKCRGFEYQCIFDTRANISSITKTFASKLGLKMLDVSYEEGSGITGIRFKCSMGIADSLYFGNILLRHVVFQVMPDEVLYLAQAQFSLDIILGFPVIEQLKEIQIYQDGRMTIPLEATRNAAKNLALDGLNPVILLKSESNDSLSFYFDSGSTGSDLYSIYFNKYRAKIISESKKENVEYGGAGGAIKANVYSLDSLSLFVSDRKVTFRKINVLSKPIGSKPDKFYGNIGQDLISQSKEMILNFEDMYILIK
jgi:hypothetical protein